jgi:hypothetical protein
MNPAILSSSAKGTRHSDIFSTSSARPPPRIRPSSREPWFRRPSASEWTLPTGKAVKTAPFWGRPSSLYVDDEEARARIMQAMGIDLKNSHTYRKYL